ncbi:MAG: glycosyltransferase family 2 protein [Chlorobium sp.]|nr:MAG: glycosyltransferase family 2 protein [Chlorobium sp.]
MRNISEFTFLEWMKLVPLVHGFKQMRNDINLRRYINISASNESRFLENNKGLAGKNLLFAVAFEQPLTLEWLIRMSKIFLLDACIVVVDNSKRDQTRKELSELCGRYEVPYLALPRNRTKHANRSHGMALTWTYYRIINKLKPEIFGFIDHDMIPVAPVSVEDRLGNQTFYGLKNQGETYAWGLWAGYCLYNYKKVSSCKLNFLYDFSRYLDTGGRNWSVLYKNVDFNQIRFADADIKEIAISDADGTCIQSVQYVDSAWVHIGGVGYNDNFIPKKHFFEIFFDSYLTSS